MKDGEGLWSATLLPDVVAASCAVVHWLLSRGDTGLSVNGLVGSISDVYGRGEQKYMNRKKRDVQW